jgi:hypothetical protein
MRSVWQCEIDPYAQRVLAKHWPDVLRVPDIRDVGAGTVPYVDVICGGFPCQDISVAGRGAGSTGSARVFGRSTPVSFASFDPDTSSWRTSQLSLLEDSGEFSETWPRRV